MFIDENKKGTIILSSYRSGGTLLKNLIGSVLDIKKIPNEDIGEIDLDITKKISKDTLNQALDKLNVGGKYVVGLLNNPNTIISLEKFEQFGELVYNYNIVYLERKDKEKSLLSLPLWEEFIKEGLFKDSSLWTKENMEKFHDKLLKKPIPFHNLTLGIHYEFGSPNKYGYLNTLLLFYYTHIKFMRALTQQYCIDTIHYELYENDPSVLANLYFPEEDQEELKRVFARHHKNKIPYISDDYSVYYDSHTQGVLKSWDLNSI